MKKNWVIAIHGGAENKSREEIGEAKEAAYRQGLDNALMAGWHVLEAGGSAVDAVEAAVRSMENNQLFNAGRGGSLTKDESIEFDAAIMDGKNMQAGSVSGVKHVKHPITLAKTIMLHSPHVLLTSVGAEKFAREQELEMRGEDYFKTEEKIKSLKKAQKKEKEELQKDTVGAVALDMHGNLAAATSTGGLENQYPGRVGDSPIIGAGTYANNEVCAVSCTGDGEGIMRANVAHEVYALMKYKGLALQEAAQQAMEVYKDRIEGDRNFIALDPEGNVEFSFETSLMFRACKKAHDPTYLAIWKDEEGNWERED
ncbi:isoaspartyl peptidase/L-asparaginase family protein [Rufibacter glacialis]|uniref:Isoaspartyl peptidase n=1 Tax=Rufibacter glacialis TaxID=1259555 RepID=A0A5M8Q4I0_9BACT|nr:isoaspartyl peptidase/L-asparaginase [Rufibacter glacialis]KAA6430785.1 isoaspartyl peptidase/L-asparaginase [Rufibacter glacialis]GGK86701.1 L-asparaginase [Rufibacter glacialis]